MYTKKALRYFRNPKYAGSLKNPDGFGEAKSYICGDSMKVYIKIKNDEISKIKIQTLGCVAGIASADALSRIVDGKSLSKALKVKSKDVIDDLGGLPAEKKHCSDLAVEGLKKAIKHYKNGKISTKV